MTSVSPFRVISGSEEDPQVKERREILRNLLTDLLERIDEVDIETFTFAGILADGSVISARHVHDNHYQILGALEKIKSDVIGLMNQANNLSSETEY